MSAGHGHDVDPSNKRIALLISVLALVLALSETLGKSTQTDALGANIEATNLWAFFQAKSIRQTTVRTAAEGMAAQPALGEAGRKQVEAWNKTADRYQSEPETGEGRKELADRAKAAETRRDRLLAAYHQYELASAAVQIAIVLASASIVTGMAALASASMGLGAVGIAFCLIGILAPTAVHLF